MSALGEKRTLFRAKTDVSMGPLPGLPPVSWTPSNGAIMRWEVCNENEEKAL